MTETITLIADGPDSAGLHQAGCLGRGVPNPDLTQHGSARVSEIQMPR